MKITPENALANLDAAAEKYPGTRADHTLLHASKQILEHIIGEWRRLSDNPLEPDGTKPEGEAEPEAPPPAIN